MSTSQGVAHERVPILAVLSGPSGVGKDAALARMRQQGRPYHFTVTATTRPQRPSERDGADYIFVSDEAFRGLVRDGELLEWAEVYGYHYGVPKAQVVDALGQGRDVIIKADIQGAATIKNLAPDGVFIFLAPPSPEELADRLRRRMTEAPAALERRLAIADAEMATAGTFDHVVINHNGRLDDAVDDIDAILDRERRKPGRSRLLL